MLCRNVEGGEVSLFLSEGEIRDAHAQLDDRFRVLRVAFVAIAVKCP